MTTFFIKPVNGVLVRDPETLKPLDENGEEKPRNSYWQRRFKDGDIVIAKPPVKKKTTGDK